MNKRTIGAVLAAMLLMGMVPAATANPVLADAGLVQSVAGRNAEVGKSGVCNRDGTGFVTGPGLGLPTVQKKEAIYVLEDAVITSAVLGAGTLNLCGWLTHVGGHGAACDLSKGYDGRGEAHFGDDARTVYYIKDLGWKASVGTIYPVKANVAAGSKGKAKDKPTASKLIILMRAGGGPYTTGNCFLKPDTGPKDDDDGMQFLFVVASYAIVPASGAPKPNDLPGTCKWGATYLPGGVKTGEDGCVYEGKPEHG